MTQQIAAYRRGDPPTTARAPAASVYEVKVCEKDGRRLRSVGESKRILREGDVVGFRTENGVVYALAGDETFALQSNDDGRLVWFTQYEPKGEEKKPSGLKRAAEIAGGVALGAVLVPVAIAFFWVGGTAQQRGDEQKAERSFRQRTGT